MILILEGALKSTDLYFETFMCKVYRKIKCLFTKTPPNQVYKNSDAWNHIEIDFPK